MRETRADAQQRGLAGRFWSMAEVGRVLGVGLVCACLLFIALTIAAPAGSLLWGVVAMVAWFIGLVVALSAHHQGRTQAGRDAASRWLGVREFLEGARSLDSLPPAAVAIWDRYLAYGAATNASHEAVRGLLLEFRTSMSALDWAKVVRETRRFYKNRRVTVTVKSPPPP